MKSIQDEVMSCKAFVELVTEYFEDTMPGGQRARFEQHMCFCAGCLTYLQQISATTKIIQTVSLADVEPPSSGATIEQLTSLFRRWKHSQGL